MASSTGVIHGEMDTVICIIGDERTKTGLFEALRAHECVESAEPVQDVGYKMVARERLEECIGNTKTSGFYVGDVKIGNGRPLIIAGPCAVQTREQTLELADAVKAAGADMFRGGVYKPRTSPYDFQGIGEVGLDILAEAREATGLPIVTEVTDPRLVETVGSVADVLQIGARNTQNFPLLTETGSYAAAHDKAVLLKTSIANLPAKDILSAAEYVAVAGATKIILCERGYHDNGATFRNNPALGRMLEVRRATHLPIIGDPSHVCGDRELVEAVANSYLDTGANGLMIEVRRDAEQPMLDGNAVCDYRQSLPMAQFKAYMQRHFPERFEERQEGV